MAAENIGAHAGATYVAGGEQQYAARSHVRRTHGVLSLSHRPDQGRRLVLREHPSDALGLSTRPAPDAFTLLRRPLLALLAHIVHAVDALSDEFLVLPAVLEDVPEHPIEHRDVGTRPQPHIFGGVRSRARQSRITDNEIGAVEFGALQQMLQ